MFTIKYKTVLHDYDGISGESGFFQIICGEMTYGDYYPPDIEQYMGTEWLFTWFENITKVGLYLEDHENAAVPDLETINRWIEFKKQSDQVLMNIAYIDHPKDPFFLGEEISADIPRRLSEYVTCDFIQMKNEIVAKTECFIEEIIQLNPPLRNENTCVTAKQKRFYLRIQKLKEAIAILHHN